MTPEDQRIAIAEACGATWKADHFENPMLVRDDIVLAVCPDESPTFLLSLPDYLNDLNAMHEAEKMLRNGQAEIFVEWLNRIVFREHWEWWWSDGDRLPVNSPGYFEVPTKTVFGCVGASATQRAEAFLRTLGKWTDEP